MGIALDTEAYTEPSGTFQVKNLTTEKTVLTYTMPANPASTHKVCGIVIVGGAAANKLAGACTLTLRMTDGGVECFNTTIQYANVGSVLRRRIPYFAAVTGGNEVKLLLTSSSASDTAVAVTTVLDSDDQAYFWKHASSGISISQLVITKTGAAAVAITSNAQAVTIVSTAANPAILIQTAGPEVIELLDSDGAAVGNMTGNLSGSVGSVTTKTGYTLANGTITAATFDGTTAFPQTGDSYAQIVHATYGLPAIKTAVDAVATATGSGQAASLVYTLTTDGTTPIPQALVEAYSDIAMTSFVTSGFTDDAGVVTLYGTAGTKYLKRIKSGYTFANPDSEIFS